MNINLRVSSRTNNIIVQSLEDEVLIYDLKSNQALSLNETAAKVWQSLDGKKTVAEIASETGFSSEIILFSIDELQKKNLLDEKVETGLAKDKISRRKMLIKAAATSVALPLIVGVIAPSAIHAQSECNPPTPPGTPSQMLAPGAMATVGYAGVCDAPCSAVCSSFNFDCCSNALLYAGTCTNNGGGAGIAVCDCTCA